MSRLLNISVLFLAACLAPVLAVTAQQPPPSSTAPETRKEETPKKAEAKKAEGPKDPIERIKEEGLKRSKVMETLSYLTDVIGPRLTGSPELKRANLWTRDTLAGWGLENAHLEPWGKFGRGWSLKRFSAQVVAPQCIPLIAFPKAWSPGTGGPLTAPVVYLDAKNEEELARFKGKLKGAIVLTGPPRTLAARFNPLAARLSDHDLLELADAPEPTRRGFGRPAPEPGSPATPVAAPTTVAATSGAGSGSPGGSASSRSEGTGGGNGNSSVAPAAEGSGGSGSGPGPGPRGGRNNPFLRRKLRFLIEEGAALLVDPSMQGDGGTLFVASASIPLPDSTPPPAMGDTRNSIWSPDAPETVPQIVLASEHYNRLVRMIGQGEAVRMEVDLAVTYHDEDLNAYNTIAELPGTDLKDELVMLGGHMDSWHSGTGATDNAAGVAVAMEAMRILKTLDLKPRRTIRIALWTGEEEGLLGSRGYVSEHFKKVPPPRAFRPTLRPDAPSAAATAEPAPAGAAPAPAPAPAATESEADAIPKAEFAKFSAYFNLDNGTGKVRGVYLQGNEAARPIFRKWLQPFRDMGATTLSLSNTGGTDHQSFDSVGLPGFQFIQDEIEYNTRTHHSNQDVYDRIQADDMKQAAVVLAAFVYNTAMMDEKLPRKPAAPR